MHVLVTTDTLTAVWESARELVCGLIAQGTRVTLVSFGNVPLPQQTSWMSTLPGLEYRPTAFRLEWMQEGEADFGESSAYLVALVREVRPDLLHLNHPCYGALPVEVPRIVVANGDYIGWWRAVHGCEPQDSRWLRWYRDAVARGLNQADLVAAPSVAMLDAIRSAYARPKRTAVIYSGCNPIAFNPHLTKEDSILAIGRLCDAGRQVALLTREWLPVPVCIVEHQGEEPAIQSSRLPLRADVRLEKEGAHLALRGPQTEAQLRLLYSRSAMYAATARYDPLGIAVIAAAFSRCAIVANDIPMHREMWGDAAMYFRANDAADLASKIEALHANRELRRSYANQAYARARQCFTAKRMMEDYVRAYASLLGLRSLAA